MTRSRPSPFGAIPCLLALGLVVGLLPDDALAQQAVQLSGVPEELAFPLPAGRNVVLTAAVEGAEPRAVWLARSRDASLRLMLSRVGAGRYQVNLADPAVAAVLRDGDRFQIFAELPDASVIASIAVHYTGAARKHAPPRVFVVVDGERRDLAHWPPEDPLLAPALRARLTGQSVVFSAEGLRHGAVRTHWCPPDRLQEVQFEFPRDCAAPAVEARAGDKAWPAAPAGRAGTLKLAITPELRRAWQQRHTLDLVCSDAGQDVLRVALRAPPARLDLPAAKADLTVTQRTSKAVPGSGGFFALYLDDITGGQVRLTLATAAGERVVDEVSVREGDVVPFATHDALYAVTVEKLVNYLVGDDYACLAIAIAPAALQAAEQEKVRALLAALEKADVVFLGGGGERTGAQMAAALRATKAPTLRQFLTRAAGPELEVRRPGGELQPARTWLDGLAATLHRKARAWAKALDKPGLPNLHQVAKRFYRGAQPTAEGFRELQKMGVKTVINLRSMHSDRDLLEGTDLAYVAIPCHAWHPEEEDVVAFLKAIKDDTKGPFFVHCQHGSDRTGLMTAVYRVVCAGWSKQEAIDEMTKGDFGFNAIWKSLPAYIRDMHVEELRRKAGLAASD